MLLTLITFFLVLSLLVFVHELGHFIMAKRFGLIPDEFGFGFPPRIWGIYKSKDGRWKQVKGKKKVEDAAGTVYSVNWLPIGGFVNLGEDEVNVPEGSNHFANKPIYQRAIILLAGVTMNVILAAVLISFGFSIGLPQVLENLGPGAHVSNEQIQIIDVLPDSPAQTAKLEVGDVVLSVAGQTFQTSEELQTFANEHANQPLEYRIKRGNEILTKEITPVMREDTSLAGIGIGVVETGLVRYPVYIAVWEGIKSTAALFGTIVFAFYGVIKNLVQGHGTGGQIAGPVGIAVLTGQVARMGFAYIVQFAAMLSINLAIINAFPFPALDGGRVLFLIIEKIKGRPVKKELEGTIHYIGFALLMLLVLIVTFKDISRFGDTFRMIWHTIIG